MKGHRYCKNFVTASRYGKWTRYFICFPAQNQGTTELENQVDYSIWDNTWRVIIQNVNSALYFEKPWKVCWRYSELSSPIRSLGYRCSGHTQHKPVFCVLHTNKIGVTADTQYMRRMVHLKHWYLSSQTSWPHTSTETNVKHSNYSIQKLLPVLMCTG
jgi:hypothetical protein